MGLLGLHARPVRHPLDGRRPVPGYRDLARALADIANGGGIDYPVVWMDIELPGIGPATDNGWNTVYTSPCSGVKKQSFVAVSLDRADFNGFWGYIKAHSHYQPGVYSSADGGTTWTRFASGLPNAQVEELVFAPNLDILAAATYGRGVWEIQVPGPATHVVVSAPAGATAASHGK